MRTRLEQVHSKLTLDIPADYALALHLKADTEVNITIHEGGLSITPVSELEDLLAQITPQNLHGEVETGIGAGREAW